MNESGIQKLFDTAIASEVEAHDFYAEAAQRVENKAVKAILEELAREEKGHEELLKKMRNDARVNVQFQPPADWGVAESVEELPRLTTSMLPADAFALAMKKEQQAVDAYTKLASWAQDPALRDACLNLANMESNHKQRLERLFIDVAYPEVF